MEELEVVKELKIAEKFEVVLDLELVGQLKDVDELESGGVGGCGRRPSLFQRNSQVFEELLSKGILYRLEVLMYTK